MPFTDSEDRGLRNDELSSTCNLLRHAAAAPSRRGSHLLALSDLSAPTITTSSALLALTATAVAVSAQSIGICERSPSRSTSTSQRAQRRILKVDRARAMLFKELAGIHDCVGYECGGKYVADLDVAMTDQVAVYTTAVVTQPAIDWHHLILETGCPTLRSVQEGAT